MAATSKFFSVDPSKPVDIVLGESGLTAEEPITIGQMFRATLSNCPNNHALASKEGDTWSKLTYTEYYNYCTKAAKSFLKLGLEPVHGVAIIGFNSLEWFVSAVGAIFAGGLACGIYATSSPEACQYIIHDCKANVVVVENDQQLQKILKVRDELPYLKAIIQYKDKLVQSYPNVYEWEQFMKLGDDTDDNIIEDNISAQKPADCAVLVYTSGTTGNPKGVMITHDNITFAAKALDRTYQVFETGDRIVSYLPLSHIAGLIADVILPTYKGMTTYFAQPDALKGSLGDTLREVQPSLFVAVPRVWEKFMEKLITMLPPPGSGAPPSAEMMKAIQTKVYAGLGFTKCKLMITCAAPISLEVLKFFAKLGIDISEIWGMSEIAGPGTCTTKSIPNQWNLGSLGKPLLGFEIKIDSPSPKTGEGEICFRGRSVMMGYLNKLEKTQETIDSEGWLHSGDIGRLDKDGFMYITGRIKEIIITSGGENIAPVQIEDNIKKLASFLSNVVLIGDRRKFLSCLVTLKVAINPATGAATNALTEEAVKLLSALGSSSTMVTDVVDGKDEIVYSAIQKAIDTYNENAKSNAQKIQKFALLKDDLSIPGGELGPTMKLKRFFVTEKYADTIDKMYN